MYSRKNITIAVICLVLLTCCTVMIQIPTATDAQKAGTTLDTLLTGRDLYINNCGSCHNLYLPSQYTRIEWDSNLIDMQSRSKITDDQAALIQKYLYSGCKY